ncbi:MAG: T9SS type A sorting domain-containing protein [bacterium]
MNKYLVLLISILCFGEINWEIEIVDSITLQSPNEFQYQNFLALDTNDIPHIVFNKQNYSKLIFARRISNNMWAKELIDSGSFYACPSLIFDRYNTPHCSYYEMIGQNAYLCYTYRDANLWHKIIIDTISDILTPYWFPFNYFRTTIDVDNGGNPGLAYVSFNPADSVFFIKYAYSDGINWQISVVEYDTGCGSINQPSDRYPNLKFNSQGIPHIGYHHIVGQTDTIRLAWWVDSLNKWVKDTVYNHTYGCAPISFAINNRDEPYIAHGVDVGLYCSYRRDGIWYHEYTGIDIGWLMVNLSIALNEDSRPSILYSSYGAVRYCCKDTFWHDYGPIDSTLDNLGDITLLLEREGKPCVSFRFSDWDRASQVNYYGVKYAKGTVVGIEDSGPGPLVLDKEFKLKVHPNISYGRLTIEYNLQNKGDVEIGIYDVIGAKRKSIKFKNCQSGNYTKILNLSDLASGVYFVALKQNNEKVSKKFLLIK